ncbi:DUF3990 domain-containing protein [Mangrovibacillus cuniculi]|uniref:DUF3990 domain-containing protein n=1 Tax=Mangrovibacillus cuniculi TaxID=2593652 RepID=A0A7S8HED2_9BACI|nr:DUF3990 domain-containing protein [Mangrovibacillus cuniculi]QPC45608.1 DUF3990 domain-containing protein [Mangrovibacillus cuniculi]
MDFQLDDVAIFYHGTVDIYGNFIRKKGIRVFANSPVSLDFGPGFYLAQTNRDQVTELAKIRAKRVELPRPEILQLLEITPREFLKLRKNFRPVIISFKIRDKEKWGKLIHQDFFIHPTHVWQDHILNCRNTTTLCGHFDTTFGPVADGGIFSGYAHKIKAYETFNQLAIHTQRAADLFEVIDMEVIGE